MGKVLAGKKPVAADAVIGVPDSSISAASGYAEEAGIPYQMGLIKNRYIGRTFIQPSQELRDLGVKLKLNPIKTVVKDKRIVMVDDSIVRGTTSKHLIALLREVGAKEIHMRVASPPYAHSCYYGVDTSRREELIAANRDVEEIRQHIGADTLAYLGLEDMEKVLPSELRGGHCVSCFTGEYPVPIPEETASSGACS